MGEKNSVTRLASVTPLKVYRLHARYILPDDGGNSVLDQRIPQRNT